MAVQALDRLTAGVVRVTGGRGFVVDTRDPRVGRVVITAAHCLPHLPPAMAVSHLEERTYPALLGSLRDEPSVWAEVLFVDPVSDIAVLGSPDEQELYAEAETFATFIESAEVFPVGVLGDSDAQSGVECWTLNLDGAWIPGRARAGRGGVALSEVHEGIYGGMSGSPIVLSDGSAFGVVALGTSHSANSVAHHEGGPQPRLTHHLPAWLVRLLL